MEITSVRFPEGITVIIRSANERTEMFCSQLVSKQLSPDQVNIIRERPFDQALRRSFQSGLEAGRSWTLCIDADVLIREKAIQDLIAFGESGDEADLGYSGYIFDKFRGGSHNGGLHLYRTKYLTEALSLVPDDPIDPRPETYVKKAMAARGHEWALTRQVFGLHDFEQYYRDIFRKMVVRSYKSSNELSSLAARASNLSSMDRDFLVAMWGLRVGQANKQVPSIDADKWSKEIDLLLTAQGIPEKSCFPLDGSEQFVSRLMAEEAASVGVIDRNAFTLSLERKIHLLKTMKIKKLVWYMGWLLNRFGVKIQKSVSD